MAVDIFLLTKPPKSDRAGLCLRMMERASSAALYLAGDGVYCLLDDRFAGRGRVVACREDMEARGVQAESSVLVPEDFYGTLVEAMMEEGARIYAL